MLFGDRSIPGTVLIETALTGESLYLLAQQLCNVHLRFFLRVVDAKDGTTRFQCNEPQMKEGKRQLQSYNATSGLCWTWCTCTN